MICSVEHVLDLLPPFVISEGEGVNIIAMCCDNKRDIVFLLETSAGIAR